MQVYPTTFEPDARSTDHGFCDAAGLAFYPTKCRICCGEGRCIGGSGSPRRGLERCRRA